MQTKLKCGRAECPECSRQGVHLTLDTNITPKCVREPIASQPDLQDFEVCIVTQTKSASPAMNLKTEEFDSAHNGTDSDDSYELSMSF